MTLDGLSGELEHAIGHRFVHRDLLAQALTHRSYGTPHNERLEFLGDGVLNCVIAALLYRRFSTLKEGDLSRLRASLVKQDAVFEVAQGIALGEYLRLGEGEIKTGGSRRPSMLADAMEAMIGAVFLDAGFDKAASVIEALYRKQLESVNPDVSGKDAKTELQELLQSRHLGLPHYELRATRGEAHAQLFDVDCQIPDLGIVSSGSGSSRRIAEQVAAQRALDQIRQK
jgi:ribonuclease-3